MRIWTLLLAFTVGGLFAGRPSLAGSGLLFDPPPLVGAKQVKVPSRTVYDRGLKPSPADRQALPALPDRLSGNLRPAGGAVVPRRLPDAGGVGTHPGPALLPNEAGRRAAENLPPIPVPFDEGGHQDSSPGTASGRAPGPLARQPSAALPALPADNPPAALPADPGYTLTGDGRYGRSMAGEGPEVWCGEGAFYDVGAGSCGPCAAGWRRPTRLLDLPGLLPCDIELGGWLDQGVTFNESNPSVFPFNGPVTFNDRSNEYQMNQLYLFAQRVADTGGWGWDVGGRVDLLYGTDYRFILANGLEDKWNRDDRLYGLAMPQAYADVAVNNLTVRMGHFYTILGYETVTAPDNFFYSHSYAMQYGEPFTHTGLLGIYDLADGLCVCAGLHRGWNQWEDNNSQIGFLGGVSWTSYDGRTSASFALSSSKEDDAGENNLLVYSVVLEHHLARRLKYVLHHNLGREEGGAGTGDAEWYGFNNYLLYDLSPCWSVGVRYEWFADDDGTRVTAANAAGGPPRGIPLAGVPARWQEVALGLRWWPWENLMCRTECRFDWADPLVPVVGGPFDDFTSRSQVLLATDLIVRF